MCAAGILLPIDRTIHICWVSFPGITKRKCNESVILQNQQAATRAGLVASKDVIEKEMESCHESIMALHGDLDAAGKQNDEARQDASAARFAAIKYATHIPPLLPYCYW